jgi:hypothetical protein
MKRSIRVAVAAVIATSALSGLAAPAFAARQNSQGQNGNSQGQTGNSQGQTTGQNSQGQTGNSQ